MGRITSLVTRLLRSVRRDRRTAALLVIAPIFTLWLLTEALSGGAAIDVIVVDDDGSPFSREILRELDRLDDAEIRHAAELDAGIEAMMATDADAVLHIGRGASEDRRVDVIVNNALKGAPQAARDELVPALAARQAQPVIRPAIYDSFEVEDHLAAPLTGALVFSLTYLLTGVSFLRERVQGTVERLFATPLRRYEFVIGYFTAFGILAFIQASAILAATIYLLGVEPRGSVALVLLALVLGALVALGMGLLLSTFAENEFQIQQFAPIVIVPQVVLGGVLVPVSSLPGWLQPVTLIMPLRYMVDALHDIVLLGAGITDVLAPLFALIGFTVLAVALTVLGVERAMRS